MSIKRKQKQEDGPDSKNMFDSFKKIFRGNPKINKLNRVVSHKPHTSPINNSSLRRRPRSQSEPDLLSDSLIVDSTDVKLETFTTKSMFIDENSLKCRSFDNFDLQLAKSCPSKAAKRLGLDKEEPTFQVKPKEQLGGGSFKGKKSETGHRSSKRFSMKSKEKEPKENRVLQMEAVEMPANVSSKAAKTLGIQPVDVPSKAAKTLGISHSQYDSRADKLTTEDFLRKIGAFASEKGKPSQKELRKQITSPILVSHRTKTSNKSAADVSTNALLRKLVQLSPTDQMRNSTSRQLMTKTQSEVSLAVSRKRRMETRSEETVSTSSSSKLDLSGEEEVERRQYRDSNLPSPGSEKRTLPRPNSLIVSTTPHSQANCKSSKSLLITDHRTIKSAFEINKETASSSEKPDVQAFPRQLPALRNLQLNQKKLLKKCQSESGLAIPSNSKRPAKEFSPVHNRNTIMMMPSRKLSGGEETPAIMLTPAPTVVKLFKKASLGDVLRGRNKGVSAVAAT
ncbi:hypothetical protein ACHWQZ_G012102 [Mnemiopsis leidyi]